MPPCFCSLPWRDVADTLSLSLQEGSSRFVREKVSQEIFNTEHDETQLDLHASSSIGHGAGASRPLAMPLKRTAQVEVSYSGATALDSYHSGESNIIINACSASAVSAQLCGDCIEPQPFAMSAAQSSTGRRTAF